MPGAALCSPMALCPSISSASMKFSGRAILTLPKLPSALGASFRRPDACCSRYQQPTMPSERPCLRRQLPRGDTLPSRLACTYLAAWSSGVILAPGARSPGSNSRSSPMSPWGCAQLLIRHYAAFWPQHCRRGQAIAFLGASYRRPEAGGRHGQRLITLPHRPCRKAAAFSVVDSSGCWHVHIWLLGLVA